MTYPFVAASAQYGTRKGPVKAFVVHLAEGGGTVGFLSRPNPRNVSVHYVIEYTGRIVQMVRESEATGSINPNELRTTDDPTTFGATVRKAVMGEWDRDPNSAAITVEIEGFAATGPNTAQHGSLRTLVADVRSRHPSMGLLGHRDFQDYKACPGKLIHWSELGGHGTGELMGLQITLPAAPLVGRLAIVKGTDAIRVSDKAHYTVPVDVVRPAYAVNLTGANSGPGYLVDLNGDEAHFIRAADATFTPPPSPDCTELVADAKAAQHEATRAAAIAAVEAL